MIYLGDQQVGLNNIVTLAAQGPKIDAYDSEADIDLTISDGNGYALARFADGHFEVKNFDTRKSVTIANADATGFNIVDENGYVLAAFEDGNVHTRNFDSAEVAQHTAQIADIYGKLYAGYEIPNYWQAHMAAKEDAINDAGNAMGSHGVSFVFFTDYHATTNHGKSVSLMRHILEHTSATEVFYGGDTIDGGTLPDSAKARSVVRDIAESFRPLGALTVRGNHDCEPSANVTTNQISDEAYYDIFVRPIESQIECPQKAYYYVDNETQRVRYIVLDTGSQIRDTMDSAQMTWFKARLTELEAGWTVVILQHMVFGTASKQERTTTMYTQGTATLNAIDEVYANLNCTIAAIICGHIHTDIIQSTQYNFSIISTTCDSGGANAEYDWDYPERMEGTTSEQAFDVFSIDTTNRTITITRVGAGVDRTATY